MSTSPVLPGPAPDDPPVLRASSVADLLGAVPVVLGFHPEESVVVLALEERRVGLRMRLDLPTPAAAAATAGWLAATLVGRGVTAAAVIAYTRAATTGDAVLAALDASFGAAGVRVVELVRYDGERYFSPRCGGPCCPAEGVPVDVGATATMARATYEGLEVLPRRGDLADRVRPVDGEARERLRRLTGAAWHEVTGASRLPRRTPSLGAGRVLAARGRSVVDAALDAGLADPAALRDEDAAALAAWCGVIPVRDHAWSRVDADPRRHLLVWEQVARRVVAPFEPPVLCLAAFAAWLCGDGARAQVALARAGAAEPSYSMALLLDDVLVQGLAPSSWEPFDPTGGDGQDDGRDDPAEDPADG